MSNEETGPSEPPVQLREASVEVMDQDEPIVIEDSPRASVQPESAPEPEATNVDEHMTDVTSIREAVADIFNGLGLDINHENYDKVCKQFDTVKQQCVMEGPQEAWLACCVYTTIWSSTPLHIKPHSMPLSVTDLMGYCGLSVMEFFDKLEKWLSMMNAPARLVDYVERVQGNFSVAIVVFDKYLPIFREIFVPNQVAVIVDPTTNQASEMGTYDVFEYIWLGFVAFKKQLTKGSEDLLSCFHLLLVIIDIVVGDMLDQKLTSFIKDDFLRQIEARDSSLLDHFCKKYDGVTLDAKHFRAHWFLAQCKAFVERGEIRMNTSTFAEFLDNIFVNHEFLSRIHLEAVMERFEIDERIFTQRLAPAMLYDESVDIGLAVGIRPQPDGTLAKNAELLAHKCAENVLNKVNAARCLRTPLSGRAYIANSDLHVPEDRVDVEENRIAQLNALVEVSDDHIYDSFHEMMKKIPSDISNSLADRVNKLNDTLRTRIVAENQATPDYDASFSKDIDRRSLDVNSLLHRFLQRITLMESNKLGNANAVAEQLASIFQRSEFITSLWVCALEIVLFTYNSAREFPWSTQLVGIPCITFFKIIEPVIRCDADLSRDMLKHLSRVEERVLEEMAWSSDSPLWKTLSPENPFPAYEEVSLHERGGEPATTRPIPLNAPTAQNASLVNRYCLTPVPNRANAKRRLDYGTSTAEDVEYGEPSSKKIGKVRNSSLYVFARKAYYLAALHLNDLCDRVRMDEKGRRRAWTLFEHILCSETRLMHGRHIDQNIMCCLYIVSKASALSINFHEILYHYRHQPQASSRVYRNVLIEPVAGTPSIVSGADDSVSRDSIASTHSIPAVSVATGMRSASTMPAPGMTSAPPTPEPMNFEYADLIQYYNRVFIKGVSDYVRKLVASDEQKIQLLPIPTVRFNTQSPRRTITSNLCVTPLGNLPTTPGRPMVYKMNRSPSKDLHRINNVVRTAVQQPLFRVVQ
uniref:CULLIN_2 domain-containing protein n=1 Tax=Panagrellus redivivus TaxID=6233 RepID=A0A7E4UQI1_PANRE